MPLGDGPLAVLASALRDPAVVGRYQAKIVSVPGSDCRWWSGAVSGRGHGRFYVGKVRRRHPLPRRANSLRPATPSRRRARFILHLGPPRLVSTHHES
jgi:hypothetical protein